MEDMQLVLKALEYPFQIAMLALFYWLFWRQSDRLQQTWERYLTSMQTIINENTQAVLATKTVNLPLTNSGEFGDPAEIMRSQVDAAGIWGQWLLAANKASQFVGTKQRTIIA